MTATRPHVLPADLFSTSKLARLDEITRERTAFACFAALVGAAGGYRPSLYVEDAEDLLVLADAYDRTQEARGDARRAYRGGKAEGTVRDHLARALSSYERAKPAHLEDAEAAISARSLLAIEPRFVSTDRVREVLGSLRFHLRALRENGFRVTGAA